MKNKLNSNCYKTFIFTFILMLLLSIGSNTQAMDYGLTPINPEVSDVVFIDSLETFVDGELIPSCNEYTCEDLVIYEGQRLTFNFQCAMTPSSGGTVYKPFFYTPVISPGNGDYDGKLESRELNETKQSQTNWINTNVGFADTYGQHNRFNFQCTYTSAHSNIEDDQYRIATTHTTFDVLVPPLGITVNTAKDSIEVGEETTVTVEFWGEVDEVCSPDVMSFGGIYQYYYNCDFLNRYQNVLVGPYDGLNVEYIKTVRVDPNATINIEPFAAKSISLADEITSWISHPAFAVEKVLKEDFDLDLDLDLDFIPVKPGSVGTSYDGGVLYTATYKVTGNIASETSDKHQLAYKITGKYGKTELDEVIIQVTEPAIICGDGIVNGTEQCDDSNTDNGDGCDSNCNFEPNDNYQCGNGILEPSEECDDSNTDNGDGCSSICKLEKVPEKPNTPIICTVDSVFENPAADPDSDGIPSENDNCPCTYNPHQYDPDGDGVGETYELHNEDGCDNCIGIANGSDEDLKDINGDGLKNSLDLDPRQIDSDGDGLGDKCDIKADPCGDVDTDEDGVHDICDNCPNTYNPDQNESDGDEHGDSCDNCEYESNSDQLDEDNDGIGNACEDNTIIIDEGPVTQETPDVVGASYGAFGGCNCQLSAEGGSNTNFLTLFLVMGALLFWSRLRAKSLK